MPDQPPLAPAPRGFGRVVRMDVRVPLWSLPRTPQRFAGPAKYESWHEKKRVNVGYGYLSILDLSDDERHALVVSEDEAMLHTYEFPSFQKVATLPVPGYKQFSRGDFLFAPWAASPGSPPDVLFAGERGVFALGGAVPSALPLSAEPADELRFTDDHAVLGASSAYIPAQQSRLVFYGFRGSRLEPLVVLDFSERVEEWDLDSEKRRLAVTYYPSNDTEVMDLAARRVLWVSGAPQYSNSVDISPDDTRLAVGGSAVVMHDFSSGQPLGGDANFGNNIHRVRFSPSGDALAVSSYEGKIRIFDAHPQGGHLKLRKLLRHTGTANVYAIRFTKDGSALVSGSGDQTVRVWGP
ncbi:MAG TPA: hypothetical protein VHE30_14810 [Polyangiaceae bacterium]|nr:hypothetical protein [Polyangiaceae bacterium]